MAESERMFDGKHHPTLYAEVWLIKDKRSDVTVFEYMTYQGNKKKALFNSRAYAEQALKKYIKNPENYYFLKV